MFGLFNKKAKPPSPFRAEVGAGSDMAAIRSAAQIDCDWSAKTTLLQGCLTAFEEGRPENLRTFIMGYLEFKRSNGAVSDLHEGGMDTGFVQLIARPVLHELERQQDPAAMLDTLSATMSVFYKQLMLDLMLREACATDGWMMVPVLIKAGADVNTGRGRPLANAGREKNIRITQVLLTHGADIEVARTLLDDEGRQSNIDAFIATLSAAKKAQPATPITSPAAPADNHAKLHITARTPIKKPSAE